MTPENPKSKPWYFKLHWQVLIALVTGVAFGWFAPVASEKIGFLGDLFLRHFAGHQPGEQDLGP